MDIYGQDNLWYVVPDATSRDTNIVLEENLDDGFLCGKSIVIDEVSGRLGVEVLGDLEWACQVATYLHHLTALRARGIH
jgi:hypothetical protein